MARIAIMSWAMGRIIMRIMVVATSAMLVHIDAQRPMPAAMSASAHMVAAIATASQASMHSCMDAMSMPMVELGIESIILLIIIVSTGSSFVSVPVNESYAVLRNALRVKSV